MQHEKARDAGGRGDYERMSREELLAELNAQLADLEGLRARESDAATQERLLYELRVHQVELEMQNRDLRESQGALEASRSRYADLYDFAPVAYFTFDERGCVEEVNLRGAAMLGREREHVLNKPLIAMAHLDDTSSFFSLLRRCLDTRGRIEGEPADGEIEVAVTNRGKGLTAEEAARIFQRFYRTQTAEAGQSAGLGLGLYIVKGLIEAHGGRIWVESIPDKTTTFHLRLQEKTGS